MFLICKAYLYLKKKRLYDWLELQVRQGSRQSLTVVVFWVLAMPLF